MATLYFYAEVNNGELDWQTLSNWWLDEAATSQPSPSLPTAADNIVIYSTVAANSGAVPTVQNVLVTDIRAATNQNEETYLSIEINVTGTATFTGVDSYLYTNDPALSPIAKVNGNCVFRDGAAPYNDAQSGRPAEINGNAEFYDNSYNYDTLITGNALVHYPAENPLGGTVNGTITYVGTPPSTRVFRAMHLPHRRREVVSEVDPTPVNVQPGEILYDETENKLYAGLEDTTAVQIVSSGGSGANNYVESDITGITGAVAITNIVSMTQAAYDALVTKDATTLYIING